MVENWIECYHHLGSHRGSVEPYQPARTTRIVPSGERPWVAMTVDTTPGLEGEPSTWIPGVRPERARDLSVWAAFPLLLGGSVARYAFWLHVTPAEVDRHRVTWHLLVHPAHRSQFPPARVSRELEALRAVHAEDMDACARVQRGLASGMIDRIRLTPLESTITRFHEWLRAATASWAGGAGDAG